MSKNRKTHEYKNINKSVNFKQLKKREQKMLIYIYIYIDEKVLKLKHGLTAQKSGAEKRDFIMK